MRTEFYVRDDIENILRAIDRANHDLFALAGSTDTGLYRAGFVAALQSVAEAFGIQYDIVIPKRILLTQSYRLYE